MKIAQILVDKGYNFKGRKMWQIAIKKALEEDRIIKFKGKKVHRPGGEKA